MKNFDYGIVGFSGAIGRAITEELTTRGYSLLLIGRSITHDTNHEYFEWKMGDECSDIMKTCSTIIYCAYSRSLPIDSEPFNDLNVLAITKIIDSLSEDQHFILISSKSAGMQSKSHYGKVKFFQEMAASKHPCSTIVRVPWLENHQNSHLDRAKRLMTKIVFLDIFNVISWRFLEIETCNIHNVLHGILAHELYGNFQEIEASGTIRSSLGLGTNIKHTRSWASFLVNPLLFSILLLFRRVGPRKTRLLADSALSLF